MKYRSTHFHFFQKRDPEYHMIKFILARNIKTEKISQALHTHIEWYYPFNKYKTLHFKHIYSQNSLTREESFAILSLLGDLLFCRDRWCVWLWSTCGICPEVRLVGLQQLKIYMLRFHTSIQKFLFKSHYEFNFDMYKDNLSLSMRPILSPLKD